MASSGYQRREESKLTIRDVVSIFFYTKKTFVLSFIGVIIGALLVAFLTPPVYKVSARLVVKPRIEKPLLFDGESSSYGVFDKVDQQTLNTVVYLLMSTDVVSEVVKKHRLADLDDEAEIRAVAAQLRGGLKAEPLSLSNIIQVEYKGGDPADITAQLNTLIDSYIEYHIQVNQEYSGTLGFFNQQAKLYRNRYIDLTNKVAETRKRLNLASPEIQTDNRLNVVRDLEINKAQLIGRMKSAAQRMLQLKDAAKNVDADGLASLPRGIREAYPALIEMERSLAQLIINVQRARSDFRSQSKPVKDAVRQYVNMKNQIAAYIRSIIQGLELEQEALNQEVSALEDQINKARQQVGDISADSVLLQRIEFERDLAEKNYQLYESKREEARINDEKDRSLFANVSIASRPQVPTGAWFPRRGLILLMSLPLALIVAIAASVIAYSMNQTVRNPTDVYLRTKIRLLGSLDAR